MAIAVEELRGKVPVRAMKPLMNAFGLPGYESSQLFGIHAPAATPVAIVGRL